MDISTRSATGADAPPIARAHVRAWQVAYKGIVPAAVLDAIDLNERTAQWHQNLIEDVLPDGTPSPANLVAEVDGVVAGFACVGVWRDAPVDQTSGELWAMYVHPDYWGIGVGYALMTATMTIFAAQGVSKAFLWVIDENPVARAFYERQGWTDDAITKLEDFDGAAVKSRRYSISP